MQISMPRYRTYIVPYKSIVVVSRQEELENPFNDKNMWEWRDAADVEKEEYGCEKIVYYRVPINMRTMKRPSA
jgi:hypothetical protein